MIPRTRSLRALTTVLSAALLFACGGQELSDKPAAPLGDAIRATEGHNAEKRSTTVHVSQVMTTGMIRAGDGSKAPGLGFGETVSGALTTSEIVEGRPVAFYEFTSDAGVTVVIDVMSNDVDPLVTLFFGNDFIGDDDDGGDGLNARLTVTLSQGGTYLVGVTSYGGGTGAFTVSLTGDGGGADDVGTGSFSGSLASGDRVLDGRLVDVFPYTGRSGEQITASVTSPEFDTYVGVLRGNLEGQFEMLGENDDANGSTNSEVTVRLPANGNYSIMVTSYDSGEVGAYELTVSSTSGGAGGTSATRPPSGVTAQGTGDPDDSYALIVGIDDYPGTQSDLRGPTGDARLIRDMLIDVYSFNPENILMLYDQDVTRDNIATGFIEHLGQAGPNGSAVFFYSGHGTQLDENIGLTAPVDNESNGVDEALYVYGADYSSSVLLDDEIGFLADQLRSDNTLIVIDACYSGTVSRGPGDIQAKFIDAGTLGDLVLPRGLAGGYADSGPKDLSDLFGEPQRHVLLAASSEDELSWTAGTPEGRSEPVSVYAHILDLVVRGMPDATLEEIGLEARRLTLQFQEMRGSAVQTPQVIGRSRGMSMRTYLGGN